MEFLVPVGIAALFLVPIGILVWAIFPSAKGAVKSQRRQAARDAREQERYARAGAELDAQGWKP